MTELFEIPENKSPRLRWIQKYEIKTFDHGVGDEDLKRWSAGNGCSNYCDGDSESEAIANWAIANSVRLWNELSLAKDS